MLITAHTWINMNKKKKSKNYKLIISDNSLYF